MTIPEAIKWYEAKLKVNKLAGLLGPQNEAAKLALAALREQEERMSNPPLSLEEVLKMDGEPVWVVSPFDDDIAPGWFLVNVSAEELYNGREHIMLPDPSRGLGYQVFRHKPKEAEK